MLEPCVLHTFFVIKTRQELRKYYIPYARECEEKTRFKLATAQAAIKNSQV